jgi:hypothetical protein
MGETAMEAHYNGHTVRITPISIGTKGTWTFSALVIFGERDCNDGQSCLFATVAISPARMKPLKKH